MVNGGNNYTFAVKENGDVILTTHLEEHEDAINEIAGELNGTLSRKLRLIASSADTASLRIIPGDVEPTSSQIGDLWYYGPSRQLRFRAHGEIKTIAFIDSEFPQLNVTGLSTTGDVTVGDALKVTGTTLLKNTTTINANTFISGRASVQSTSDSAFVVRYGGSADKNMLVVNGANKSVSLWNGADFRIFNDDGATAKFTINGSNGNVSTQGSISATGNITSGGTATASAYKVGSATYAAPDKLNTGGFTIIVGNGVDALTSDLIDIPAVIIPYACTATAVLVHDTSNTASSINIKLEKASWGTNPSFATAETIALSSDKTASKSTNFALAQNDIVRLRINSGTPTSKQIAVHVRVVRE